ncbi:MULTISPECIES: hypothetical protein, partial [unclassified Commensalibacter]|uniref:hypothetical protein n=1 Tax=unclassified Commensalibacter TaxID=2630218 RepID=UPI001E4ACF60
QIRMSRHPFAIQDQKIPPCSSSPFPREKRGTAIRMTDQLNSTSSQFSQMAERSEQMARVNYLLKCWIIP